MLSAKHPPQRNAVDFKDSVQIRALIKRLNISLADLHRMIEKSGNSIAAITKKAELKRLASAELLTAEREQ